MFDTFDQNAQAAHRTSDQNEEARQRCIAQYKQAMQHCITEYEKVMLHEQAMGHSVAEIENAMRHSLAQYQKALLHSLAQYKRASSIAGEERAMRRVAQDEYTAQHSVAKDEAVQTLPLTRATTEAQPMGYSPAPADQLFPQTRQEPSDHPQIAEREGRNNRPAYNNVDMSVELADLDARLNERLESRRQVMAANGTLNVDATISGLQALRDDLRRFNESYDEAKGWTPSSDSGCSPTPNPRQNGANKAVNRAVSTQLRANMEARKRQPPSLANNSCHLCGFFTPMGQYRWTQCPNCGIPASWQ